MNEEGGIAEDEQGGLKWRSGGGGIEKEEQGEIEEEEDRRGGSMRGIPRPARTTSGQGLSTPLPRGGVGNAARRRGPNDDGTSPTNGNYDQRDGFEGGYGFHGSDTGWVVARWVGWH